MVSPDSGNLTDDGLYQYAYDAWNRLVEVRRHTTDASPGSPQRLVATYSYDGLGHRIYKHVENSGNMNREEYFYYNNRWQLLEIDNAAGVARQQFVWGTNYIDEAVCMDVDTGTDGDCTDESSRHFFYMQDANWNVTGLWEDMGSGPQIVERYEYDPYGTVRIYRGSATAGAAEQRSVAGQSLKWMGTGLPANPFLYAGYFHDSVTGLYDVRRRPYNPQLGRWMPTDPAGYVDGMNLFEYVKNGPVVRIDPLGLQSTQPSVDKTQACCKYSETTQVENTGPLYCAWNWSRRFQQEEPNTGSWHSPQEVCKCAGAHIKQAGSWRSTSIDVLDDARWGKCCRCSIELRRGPLGSFIWIPGKWLPYTHEGVIIRCDDGTKVLLDAGPTEAGVPDVIEVTMTLDPILVETRVSSEFPIPGWKGAPIDCACVSQILTRAATWNGTLYAVYNSCIGFAHDIMNFASQTCYH